MESYPVSVSWFCVILFLMFELFLVYICFTAGPIYYLHWQFDYPFFNKNVYLVINALVQTAIVLC